MEEIFNNPLVISLFAAFVGAFVATLYYFYKWKLRDRQLAERAFSSIWISSRNLEYKDLSGRKEFQDKNPSTQTHLRELIQSHLDSCENILLISEPLAGKTFFTVNHLRKLENAYVLIPDSDKFDELFSFIPEPPQKANYKIVLIDDIYSYLNARIERLPSFIEKSMEAGYTIWANTISGPEFENIRNHFSSKLLSTFNEIIIPSTLSDKEALSIAKSEGINELPLDFDKNIGSIFYPIDQIRSRYVSLDGIGKLLLRTIKELYLVGIYRTPSLVLKSNARKLFDYYEPNISPETINKKIDELLLNGFLLKSNDPKSIRFEERYLKKVVEPELLVRDVMVIVSEVFPKNVATYTQAMQSTSSYEDAKNIYDEMRSNEIQPGVRPFAVLLGKANDSDIGLAWLNEMDKLGILIDDYIVNILFLTTKGDTEKKARVIKELNLRNIEVKEKIKNLIAAPKIQISAKTYGNLINLSGNYTIGKQLFNEMIGKGIEPNKEIYGTLINLAEDYNIGKQLFDEMIEKRIEPNEKIYGTLINLSDNYNIGKQLFDDMIEKGIEPNKEIYGTLINLSKDYIIGKQIFDNMIEKDIEADVIIYGTLINLSEDYNIGKQLFDEMIEKGIEANVKIYSRLIGFSHDFNIGKELFDQMKKNNILPDINVFSILISLSGDFKLGKELFDQMEESEIEPDVQLYGIIINLCGNYEVGKQLFKEMKEKGIGASVEIYTILIGLSRDYTIGRQLFEEMKESGIFPDIKIYSMLINLSKNIREGRMLLNEMLEKKIKPDTWIYNVLIWLFKYNYQRALAILQEEMPSQNVKPNSRTYTQLMTISRNFDIAIELFKEMCEKKIYPNYSTYRTLSALVGDNIEKQKMLNELWNNYMQK